MIPPSAIQIVPTLKPGGYNLGIQEWRGQTWMSYRYHPKPDHWRTQLVISREGIEGPVILPEKYKEHSHEDCRMFVMRDKLMASCVVSRSRMNGQSISPCIVGYGEVVGFKEGYRLENWIEPRHADNVWSKQTKNLVFHWSKQGLLMTWATHPKHTVHLLDDAGKIISGWVTESPKTSAGNYRGGVQSFPYNENRIRFCHSVRNNPKTPLYWGYSLIAYVFEPQPPFKIIAVSKQPILTGNEAYEPNCPHWKPKVVICYGAIKQGDDYLVSCGFNDSSCGIVKVRVCDLNL